MYLLQFTLNIVRILVLYFLFHFIQQKLYFEFTILLFSGLCDILVNCNVSLYLFFIIFLIVGMFDIFETKNLESIIIMFYNFMLVFHYGFYKTISRKQNFYQSVNDYLNELNNCTNETDECFICLENSKEKSNLKILPCSHVYHPECILKWFQKNKDTQCPVCKKEVIHINKIMVV